MRTIEFRSSPPPLKAVWTKGPWVEIRVQTAVVSYQFRNVLQQRYLEVPGFVMPRQTQLYGVRWDFWN